MSAPTQKKKRISKKIEPYQSAAPLNLPAHATAAFISISMNGKLTGSSYGGGFSIVIGDCNRRIELHGGISKPESRKNAIYKMDQLIEQISAARDHLINECKSKKVQIPKSQKL